MSPDPIENGELVTITGRVQRVQGDSRAEESSDIYKSAPDSKIVGLPEITEPVKATVLGNLQSMGASGIIAAGSATFFQAQAISENFSEAYKKAEPLFIELYETGTIKPPEGSKYAGVEVPKTTSFFGVKVGDGRISKEEKALQDGLRQSITPNGGAQTQQGSPI